ncbi:MAG: UvrD-helicase domain-containing protein, partial [Parachlamydiaceae bacterium]
MNLDDLNPEQREAVLSTEGRVLILAGAGSGKTKVLTCRMAYLISVKGVPPQAVLGLTFTNKAAAEMRKRLASMVGPNLAKKATLATFHSYCLKILREEIHHLGFTKNFTLYDEEDRGRIVKTIARDLL